MTTASPIIAPVSAIMIVKGSVQTPSRLCQSASPTPPLLRARRRKASRKIRGCATTPVIASATIMTPNIPTRIMPSVDGRCSV
ncbi:hypothetical protein BF95_10190 [Sphingobium sp. Ant17]|nr:hypothetical protein BF95_10190 [Sphingobium sp. Ant17]